MAHDEQRPHLRIIELLKKEKLLGIIKYSCNARSNLITEDTVKLMKELRIVSVGMGLETMNQKTLTYLKPQAVTVEHNKRAIELLRKYKISANASFVIGCPDETEEDVRMTYNEIKKSRLSIFEVYFLTPLPGTPVWTDALERGLVSNDMNWKKLDVDYTKNMDPIIMSKVLKKDQLVKWYWKFQRLKWKFIFKSALTHPYLETVPRYIFGKTKEFISERF